MTRLVNEAGKLLKLTKKDNAEEFKLVTVLGSDFLTGVNLSKCKELKSVLSLGKTFSFSQVFTDISTFSSGTNVGHDDQVVNFCKALFVIEVLNSGFHALKDNWLKEIFQSWHYGQVFHALNATINEIFNDEDFFAKGLNISNFKLAWKSNLGSNGGRGGKGRKNGHGNGWSYGKGHHQHHQYHNNVNNNYQHHNNVNNNRKFCCFLHVKGDCSYNNNCKDVHVNGANHSERYNNLSVENRERYDRWLANRNGNQGNHQGEKGGKKGKGDKGGKKGKQ